MTEHVPAAAAQVGPIDTGACPVCGLPLSAAVCRWCGVDLAGPDGDRLRELSARSAELLAERRELVATLRARAGRRRPTEAPKAPRIPVQRDPRQAARTGHPTPRPTPEPTPEQTPEQTFRRFSANPTRPDSVVRRAVGTAGRSMSAARVLGLLAVVLATGLAVSPAGQSWNSGDTAGLTTLLVLAVLVTIAIGWTARRRTASATPGATASADGAAVVVLVLGDVWLVRAGGLLGADRASLLGFLAAAVTAAAATLLGWGLLGRLRAAVTVGALLAPLSPVLGAAWAGSAAGSTVGTTTATRAAALAAGLLAGAGLATLRGLDGLSAVQRNASRVLALVLLTGASAALVVTVLGAPTVPAAAVGLALALPLVTLLQSLPDPASRLHRLWQLAAAALAPLAGGLAAQAVVHTVVHAVVRGATQATGRDAAPPSWVRDALPGFTTSTTPMAWWPLALGAAGTAVVLSRWADRYDPFRYVPADAIEPAVREESARHRGRAAQVAHLSAALAALPLVAVPAGQLLAVAAAAAPPWRYGAAFTAPGHRPVPYLLTAAILFVVARLLRRPSGPAAVVAAGLTTTALVAGPISPGTPVWLGLLLLGLNYAGALRPPPAADAPRGHRTPPGTAVAAAVISLVAALAVAVLTVAVTLACAVTLLVVRRRASAADRPWLLAAATSCLVVGVGAAAALLPEPAAGRAFLVALVAAATAAAAAALPRGSGGGAVGDRTADGDLLAAALGTDGARVLRSAGRLGATESAAIVVTSGSVALACLTPGLGAHPSPVAAALVTGLVLVAAVLGRGLPGEAAATDPAVATVGDGHRTWGPRILSAAVPALTTVTVALVAVAPARAAAAWAPDVLTVPGLLVIVASLVVAGAATVAGVGGRLRPGDPRRVPGELGTLLTATGCATAALSATGPVTWWAVTVILAAGLGAAALPADRRRLAWPCAVLLLGDGWTCLLALGQRTPEGYAVLVAAAVAVLALVVVPAGPRRGRLQRVALALAVVPGVAASITAGAWRPALWLTGAAVALGAAVLSADVSAAGARGSLAPSDTRPAGLQASAPQGPRSLLVVAAAAAALAGTLHAVGAVVRQVLTPDAAVLAWSAVELWSLPAAVLVGGYVAVQRVAVHRSSRLGGALLVLAAGPTALAAGLEAATGQGPGLRAAALLVAGGGFAVVVLRRAGDAVLAVRLARRAVTVAVLGAALGAAVQRPLDAWTTALGVVLLLTGERLTDRVRHGEWWALTPGLVVLLGPGAWMVLAGDGGPRCAVLLVVGSIVAVVGRLRRRLPLVVGGLIAVAVAVVKVGAPWVLEIGSRLPRWADVALVAVVVLALGAVRGRRGDDSL